MSKPARLQNIVENLEFSLQTSPGQRRRFVASDSRRHSISILDEFSFLCFSDVLHLWAINPREVEAGLRNIQPDFLFVESAWNGNKGSWRYMITSSTGPKQPLKDLIELCRKLDIPTVFWNKEDPPHFEEFRDTARLFDYVYTTEGSLVEEYRSYVGHQNVGVLQFAASPKIHNPYRVDRYRSGDVAFGGQYFQHKFPERRAQMDALFQAAAEHNFSIFSRALGGPAEYQFPAQYEPYIKGTLPYDEMVLEYKRHKVFININSVVNSETMCARRVFELSAAKTNVISIQNAAIERVFGRNAVSLASHDPKDIETTLENLLDDQGNRLQRAQNAWRTVARDHLYGHRVDQILSDLKINNTINKKPSLALIFVPGQFEQPSTIFHTLSEQVANMSSHAEIHLYMLNDRKTSNLAHIPHNASIRFVENPEDLVRRFEADTAEHDYISVMRGDRQYGPNYLWDLFHNLKYFAAESVTSKVGTSPASRENETSASYVYSGGWLAESQTPALGSLILREYRELELTFSLERSVYLSDGFSFSSSPTNPSWGV